MPCNCFTKTSNTMNLHFHLWQKHPQLHTELMKTSECNSSSLSTSKASSKTVKDLFKAQTKLSSSLREHKKLTKSIIYFLAKDMLPAYTVEKSGFKQMLSKFNPHYDQLQVSHTSAILYCLYITSTRTGLCVSSASKHIIC